MKKSKVLKYNFERLHETKDLPTTGCPRVEVNIKIRPREVIDLWRLPKNSSPALDEFPNPYYCGT
jgi:hypothetical protein